MPNLIAVFDSRGIFEHENVLSAIEATLAPEHIFRVVKQAGPNYLAVNFLNPSSFGSEQPFFQDDSFLIIDGAFYDDRPIAELVGILFSEDPRKLKTINGQFNAIVVRPMKNQVTIITDRLGSRPLYYAVLGRRHVVSSTIAGIRTVLNLPLDMSSIGLVELFAFGHNIDDRTVLKDVSVLPPGTVTTIGASGVRRSTYYELHYTQSDERLSHREWGERIAGCLKSAAPKYLTGRSRQGMFLSGGLDSRIVAGAIGNAGRIVHAYTFGDQKSREVRFANDIARQMGFPHLNLTFPSNYLSMAIKDVVNRTECATPFYHTTSIVFHDEISQDTDCILVGFGGSLSGSQLKRSVLSLTSKSVIAERIFNGKLCANPADIARIFQPAFFNKYWPRTIEAFYASFETIDEVQGANVADVWEMRNRQRRFTFTAPKVDRPRFEVVAPMLDSSYVDLMTSLPVDARWKQSAYRHAIVDGFPLLRSVPWAKTGRPVPPIRTKFWADEALRIGGKAFQAGLNRIGFGGNLTQDKYRNIAFDIREDEYLFSNHLYPYLSSSSLPQEIFDPSGVRRLVEDHMRGQDNSHLLGAILTVAVYFGG